jgi:tetratricopeptide (TPR) repeat protein
MFQPWRYHLREAQSALSHGRLEDTERLIASADLVRYLPGKELLNNLADALANRASERGSGGDFRLAWHDLRKARELGGQSDAWLAARNQLVQYELEVLQNHLRASDHSGALLRLDELARRDIEGLNVATLKELVQRLDAARRLMQHGKFPQALEHYTAAAALHGNQLPVTGELLAKCERQAAEARPLHEALHRALTSGEWSEALKLADQLLAITPLCPIANEARRRAWEEVGARSPTPSSSVAEPNSPAGPQIIQRGMLWIDGVGGYLVCLDDVIVIGQSFPGANVAIPIQADLAREHLRIRREGEGYILEPLAQPVRCSGRAITAPALLSDGDELELGSNVRIRFHRPHPLSASARIDFLSRHRPRPFADSVLLMAESCVLGPKKVDHVICRDWANDVVLYRDDGQLACRAMEPLEIDGVRNDGRGKLTWNSHVAGSDFTFKLEPLK